MTGDQVEPTPYEKQILQEIHAWRQRQPGPWGRVVARANKEVRKVTDLAFKVPGVQWTVDNVAAGLLRVTNELVQDTVWQESIYAAYRRQGHPVKDAKDIHTLGLRAIEDTLEGADIKYRALTGVQGVAAGAAGIAGLIPDIVGLVALNLRAAGEYATYYGFDMTEERERWFALHILDAEAQYTATNDGAEGRAQVGEVSRALANRYTKDTVRQVAMSVSVRGIARTLGRRLTLIKLGQSVPLAGALIGGGVNVLYTQRVCTAALHLYRERRLMERYPQSMLKRYHAS